MSSARGRTEYRIGYGELSVEFIHVSHRPSDGGRLPRYIALYDDRSVSNFVDNSESFSLCASQTQLSIRSAYNVQPAYSCVEAEVSPLKRAYAHLAYVAEALVNGKRLCGGYKPISQ